MAKKSPLKRSVRRMRKFFTPWRVKTALICLALACGEFGSNQFFGVSSWMDAAISALGWSLASALFIYVGVWAVSPHYTYQWVKYTLAGLFLGGLFILGDLGVWVASRRTLPWLVATLIFFLICEAFVVLMELAKPRMKGSSR